VRYEVRGPLARIIVCHCSVCRGLHGEAAAYTRCDAEHFVLAERRGLAAFTHRDATYSFCRECGSQLFWQRRGRPTISIAAGSLTEPTGLDVSHHIWVGSRADWETIPDGLPAYEEGTPVNP
jgi:hypothetical protein